MSPELLRSLVWLDYRLAILFAAIIPLILHVWALVKRADAMQRLLSIYWRVASLLAIVVYLMIGNLPLVFLAAPLAFVLIPVSLWFWVDLNEEIDDQRRSPLKLTFTSWRWAMTVYGLLGAIASLPFLSCAFSTANYATPFCQVWREPALAYKDAIHPNFTPQFLGFFAIVGVIIYMVYLIYFVVVRLGKQGRSAMEQ